MWQLKITSYCVCVKHIRLFNCLCVFFLLPLLLFFSPFLLLRCSRVRNFGIANRHSSGFKKYGKSRLWVQLSPMYPYVRTVIGYNIYISISPMTTEFGRQVHLQELTQIRLIKQVLMTSSRQNNVTNLKHYICTTSVPLRTELSRMVTYLDRLLSIKPYNHLITWPFKITWKTKTFLSLPPHSLWQPNVARWWLTLRASDH